MSEIAAIAEEAYLYAYPMLVGYGFFYRQAMGAEGPEKQAINRLTHFRTLASPTLNNTIPWVNTDTLYSAAWLDLRAEPMVLSTPAFEPNRYQNVQANDWYTMNFFTSGTRDRGNAPARYLFAGPDWVGPVPAGIDAVAISESWIVKLFTRILVEGPGDEPAIHALQDQYRLEPLSTFLGTAPTASVPFYVAAPDPSGLRRGVFFEQPTPDFIRSFNRIMRFAQVHPSEAALFERFSRIGIRPGTDFDPAGLAEPMHLAIQAGIDTALAKIAARLDKLEEPVHGWVYPLDLRGGRAVLAGSARAYLNRAAAARYAIWGPTCEEVVYMTAETDAARAPLDGRKGGYTLRFEGPVPARGFWSFTAYDAESRLLVPHPTGRYKRGDRDPDLRRDADGSLTLFVQHEEPPPARRGNWLPVPKAPFQIVARLYDPDPALLSKSYRPPPLIAVAMAGSNSHARPISR